MSKSQLVSFPSNPQHMIAISAATMKKSNSEKYSAMTDMIFSSLFLRLQYYHNLMNVTMDFSEGLGGVAAMSEFLLQSLRKP